METLLVGPPTSHRSVMDCPCWIEVGSATNCTIMGAAGGEGCGAGCTGGGGGGASGDCLLQPAANIASAMVRPAATIFRALNMNGRLLSFTSQSPKTHYRKVEFGAAPGAPRSWRACVG